jgi:hypothetical protein
MAPRPSRDGFLAGMRKAVVGIVWGVFCGVGNGLPAVTTLVQMAEPTAAT